MKRTVVASISLLFLALSCQDDDMPPGNNQDDLTGIPYNPTAYSLQIPEGFPSMNIPAENPMTVEGIDLGRRLFYDPVLSKDSTVSCSSCHNPTYGFDDNKAFSPGVNNLLGNRSSMSLMNIGFINAGLFWDGRSPNLEDQALHPVENPVEMAEIWDHVEMKIQRHTTYPELFRKAFGISKKSEITKVHVSKALAQFERTLISAKSKFDQYKAGNFDVLNDKELYGSLIYYDDQFSSTVRGHCAHCHDGNHLLTSEVFRNNAITQVSSLHDFPDKGLGAITGKLTDNGVFKAPSLRNIALTAPYMHDGRFQTLEEVIDHYNSGGHYADNVVTGSIQPLGLNQYDKEALKAFLLTMTDTVSLKNPAFLNPFQ